MNPLDIKNACPCNGCAKRDVTESHNCHTDCTGFVIWKIIEDWKKSELERQKLPKAYRHENFDKVLSKKHK